VLADHCYDKKGGAMIRTLLKLTYAVSYVATAAFALAALLILLLTIVTGISVSNLVIALMLVGLSIGSCALYECVGIFIDG